MKRLLLIVWIWVMACPHIGDVSSGDGKQEFLYYLFEKNYVEAVKWGRKVDELGDGEGQ